MAVTKGKSPILMTAVGDAIGGPNAKTIDGREWKICEIRVVNAAGAGTCTLLDQLGGQKIFESVALAANTADNLTHIGRKGWVDGVYVSALAAGATVYLYYD